MDDKSSGWGDLAAVFFVVQEITPQCSNDMKKFSGQDSFLCGFKL